MLTLRGELLVNTATRELQEARIMENIMETTLMGLFRDL